MTKPWVVEAVIEVIAAPFVVHGNVATAGGCLASQCLAAWMIARGSSTGDAEAALRYGPAGEKEAYVERDMAVVAPFLEEGSASPVVASASA